MLRLLVRHCQKINIIFLAKNFDYNPVTMIPVGATDITIYDNSKNYLGGYCDVKVVIYLSSPIERTESSL